MVAGMGSVKKSMILAAAIALLLAPVRSFAEDSSTTVTHDTKIISGTRTITNTYNAFGSLMSSTEISDQVVKTTSTVTKDGKETKTTSYTEQHTIVTSEWIGGGLKTTQVEGYSVTGGDPTKGTPGKENPASDESWSRTDFKNVYQYDANGRLCGVTGGIEITDDNGNKMLVNSVTTGSRGKDAEGKALGTFTAYSIDTYEIRNGQALKVKTESVQITNGFGDNKDGVSKTETTTTYDYKLMGGTWVLNSTYETTDTITTSGDAKGSTSHQEKETIYHRNEDGTLVTTKTGGSYDAIEVIMHEYTDVVKGNGGSTTWVLKDYSYTVSLDEQQGYYISSDTISQKIDDNAASGYSKHTTFKIIQDVLEDEDAEEINRAIKAAQAKFAAHLSSVITAAATATNITW